MNKESYLGITATVVAALLWSTGGLFIKLIELDAFGILFYRSIFCALIFAIIFGKGIFKISKYSVIAALLYAPLMITFVMATKITTAANAIFLQYMAPAFVLLAEPYLMKTRLQPVNVVTLIACFLGMALFFVDSFSVPENALGIGLAILSGILLAGVILAQKLNAVEFHASGVFWGNVLAFLAVAPFVNYDAAPTTNELLMLLFLGVVQLGGGYVLFLYGQRYIPAIESALIAMLEPILNPVWVFIGYGEHPGQYPIWGGAVIVFSLLLRMLFLEHRKRLEFKL